jgi:hypothetical protein
MLSNLNPSMTAQSLKHATKSAWQCNNNHSMVASSPVYFGSVTADSLKMNDKQASAKPTGFSIDRIGVVSGEKLLKIVQDASRLGRFNLHRLMGFSAKCITAEDVAAKLGLKIQDLKGEESVAILGQINHGLGSLREAGLLDEYKFTMHSGVMAQPYGQMSEWAPQGATAMTGFPCPY